MNTTTPNETMIALPDRSNRPTRLFHKRPSKVTKRARRTLEESELFRGRSKLIRIEEQDGRLVLEGRLPTYYLKQMLQTVLRDVDGVERIDNHVSVDYPSSD